MKEKEFEKTVQKVVNDLENNHYFMLIGGDIDQKSSVATVVAKGDPEILCDELVHIITNTKNAELAAATVSVITNAVVKLAMINKDYGKKVLNNLSENTCNEKAKIIGINDGK